jgi:8-oxo-dGTP diphosphatase
MSNRQCVRAIVLNGEKMLAMKRNKQGYQYYTLVGGGIEEGEEPEAALRRELQEETGMQVGSVRLVWVEDAGNLFGEQYIYLCDYIGGDPKLAPDSEEQLSNQEGQNLYHPIWLTVTDLPDTLFRSGSVKQALVEALRSGFPVSPQRLAWKPESVGE